MNQPASPSHALTLPEILAIIAVVVIWGVNNAAAKVGTEVLPPLLMGAMRFALAAACLVPFVRPPFPNWKSLLIIVFVGGPLHYGLIFLAFSLERLSKYALAGMIIAFIGVAWMMGDPHVLQDWKAIAVGIAAAGCWALTTVIARRTTSIPPLKMQGLLSLVALPTLAFGSAVFEHGQMEAVRAATPLIWACVLWAGLVSSVLATTLVFWLVQRREAGRVTPYLLATPVVSIAIGWLFLGDVLTVQILTGAALTMGGVAVVALAERGLRAGAAKG